MSLLSRIVAPFRKANPAGEGNFHPGPYHIIGPHGGWLPDSWGRYANFWQMDYDPLPGVPGGTTAMVEACVSAYSQTIAMCPGSHWRKLDNGGREEVTNSDLSRILKEPNDYQTISDFLLNLVRRLYEFGEGFALVTRNARGEVDELHLMRDGFPNIAVDGSIFYTLG